jgi:hypothetical protein
LDEISIIQGITSISESNSGSISTVSVDTVIECQEVTLGLGHLFSVNSDVTIAEETSRPVLGVLPDSGVVVEGHGQVISDEILGGNSQIHWVPVFKFFSHLSKLFFGDISWLVGSAQEDVIEDIIGQVLRVNSKKTRLGSFHIT